MPQNLPFALHLPDFSVWRLFLLLPVWPSSSPRVDLCLLIGYFHSCIHLCLFRSALLLQNRSCFFNLSLVVSDHFLVHFSRPLFFWIHRFKRMERRRGEGRERDKRLVLQNTDQWNVFAPHLSCSRVFFCCSIETTVCKGSSTHTHTFWSDKRHKSRGSLTGGACFVPPYLSDTFALVMCSAGEAKNTCGTSRCC